MSAHSEDGRNVVARGRIRVDARRALAKLREHLLVDLHLYATEIARAAIASKASFLDVAYDTNDVILTFDGHPITPTALPRLLDHVLGDGHTTDRALRGLALGVNAALGLGPAFVDIYVRTPDERRAYKVRFAPSVLEKEDASLPEVEMVAPPNAMPAQGMRIHVRRRLNVNLLKHAVKGAAPREIVLLTEALHESPIKLTSHGASMPLAARPTALLRCAFELRDAKRGTIEIVAVPASAQIDFLELGVLLLRKPFAPQPILPNDPHAQIELPIRVTIDAEQLPTNASRSAIREDSILAKNVESAARDALVLVLQTLVALVTKKGKPIATVEVLDNNPKKLEEALGAIVCVVAGALRRGADLSEQARALLDLPLLQNAVGANISPISILEHAGGDVYVHDGKEPLPKELEPWLDDVVWLRGKIVERILVDFGLQDVKARLAAAKVAHARRNVLHARPPSEPTVPSDGHLVKDTFFIQDGPFKGLRGQLALGAEGERTGQRPTTVRIYVDGRHIDTLTIDRDKLPISIDAAIAWDGHLLPKFSYEGILDNPSLRLAIFQLTRLSLLALGGYFERSVQENRPADERAQVLPIARAAIGAFAIAAKALGVENAPDEPPLHAYTPMWTRGLWTSANMERQPVSLAELKTYSDRTKAICYTPPGSTGVAPDNRPVPILTNLEREWLQLVFPDITFVPYARALRSTRESRMPDMIMFQSIRASLSPLLSSSDVFPSMSFEVRDGCGIISPSIEDKIASLHAGVLLSTTATNKFVEPALIVLEHDATVPNATWDGILWAREHSVLTSARNELVERIVAAFEGDTSARRSLHNFPSQPGPALRAYLIEAVPRFRTKELAQRIERLPLVTALDETARPVLCSLADVAARFVDPAPIPYLRAAPAFPTLDWYPILVQHDRELTALVRWAGQRLRDASNELDKRAKAAHGEMLRRHFLQRPKARPSEPSSLADPEMASVVWQEQPPADGGPVASVVASLPRKGLELPLAVAEIFLEERLVCSKSLTGLPVCVAARVFLPSNAEIIGYADLTTAGVSAIENHVYLAACALATDLINRAHGDKWPAVFHDRRVLSLLRSLYATSAADVSRSDILRADFALRVPDFLWPTVQGDCRAYSELVPGGGKLYYGTMRYEEWQRPNRNGSELDSPILYIPATSEGDLLRDILGYMGHQLTDVSTAVVALQNRRRPGSGHAGPTLSGTPVHPALRTSLRSLKLDLDGEIELIQGTESSVNVETLHGSTIALDVEAPITFRAILRIDNIDLTVHEKERLGTQLAKCAVTFIESFTDRLNELPYFVRTGLRLVVLKYAAKGKNLSKRRQRAEVFQDIFGDFRSIAELAGNGETPYPYVTIPPPYPTKGRPRPPIYLHASEVGALSGHIELQDVTENIRREIMSQARRHAQPLAFIGLDTAQRLECLEVVPFTGDESNGVEGAIGILAPEHIDKRGIWVHKDRRPLCKLPDAAPWPIIAVINDNSIPENKSFDGIQGAGPKDRLRQQVIQQAAAACDKWFVAPSDALASCEILPTVVGENQLVMGALWLPSHWTASGMVEVRDSANRFFTLRAVVLPDVVGIDGTIPVCGRLFIAHTTKKKSSNGRAALVDYIFQQTAALLRNARPDEIEARMLEPYRWLMTLLGADLGELTTVAADGRIIHAREISETLQSRREIWVTQGQGDIEGQFPAGLPPFILRDDASPLVQVLRARTKAVRDFAVVKTNQPIVELRDVEVDDVRRDEPIVGAQTFEHQVFVAPESPDEPLDVALQEATQTSWLRSLVQRVVVFFDRPEPLEPWTEALGPSLTSAIDKLGLTPVCVLKRVRFVRRGRPMSFVESSGDLVINRSHPAVRSLAERAPHEPRARLLLVVAAVREINRVLEVVTDAMERRVLLALLRGESL